MHAVSFNAAFNAAHLMSKGPLTPLVLLGEGKGSPFFHWSMSSRATVLKKRALNTFCLIRRDKIPPFFSLVAASSTGVHRVRDERVLSY